MRAVMIHAVTESMPPVQLAFQDEFPDVQLVNVLDESLFVDFNQQITPELQHRMTQLIRYCAANGADAIALACSFYAPVVESAREVVNVPVLSSYDPVMEEAMKYGGRIGIIATFPATLRDSEFYLRQTAQRHGVDVDPVPCLAEDLFQVKRSEGEAAFQHRLADVVEQLAPNVDAVLLGQFSMASAYAHLKQTASVPVLSAPHCSARRLKELLTVAAG